jgi:hypothetical protein
MSDTGNEEESEQDELPNILDLSGGGQPVIAGDTPDWFTGADAHVLFILNSGLTLTPSIIAENSDVTRQTVSKRLNTLQAGGYVEKVARGKYKITPDGRFVVTGDPEVYPNVDPEDLN